MIKSLEPVIAEIHQEAAITRRVFERIPEDKLTWKPHPKSMSMGQLALHIASVPGNLSKALQLEEFSPDVTNFNGPQPATLAEIHSTLEQSTRAAEQILGGLSEQSAAGNWCLKINGHQIFQAPRAAVIRSVMLNHVYHHRGQLSVYLRLLDIPVPIIYGRSADESPF